jgi:predicted O-methyltransferase YrrM
MPNVTSRSPIRDVRINAIAERVRAQPRRPGPLDNPNLSRDPFDYAEYGFSIVPEQGNLIYLLCRGMHATRVVEFATSVGMSTLYFAAAMRDNGGGTVIGSELVPAKVAAARRNLPMPVSPTMRTSARVTPGGPCATWAFPWISSSLTAGR